MVTYQISPFFRIFCTCLDNVVAVSMISQGEKNTVCSPVLFCLFTIIESNTPGYMTAGIFSIFTDTLSLVCGDKHLFVIYCLVRPLTQCWSRSENRYFL